MSGYIYILFNKPNGTLYTGVTNNLIRRVYEHKNRLVKGFTSRYKVDKLAYFEEYDNIDDAILREKQIKAGSRSKKIAMITEKNPTWEDLYYQII